MTECSTYTPACAPLVTEGKPTMTISAERLIDWKKGLDSQLDDLARSADYVSGGVTYGTTEDVTVTLDWPDDCRSIDDVIAFLQFSKAVLQDGQEIELRDGELVLVSEVTGDMEGFSAWGDMDDQIHDREVDRELERICQ
jgi:hypothetical protein